jgi:hypothetical protein
MILVICIIIVILCIYFITDNKHINVQIEDRKWTMINVYDNSYEAAQLLSNCNKKLMEFLRYLKDKYHVGETDDVIEAEGDAHYEIAQGDAFNIVNALLSNYNPYEFYENDPATTMETSWTINKGDSMHLCLRMRDDPNKLIDANLVLFVMLHESAHIANYNGWGHPVRFWEVFKFLLYEAENSGIMRNINYKYNPVNYCGLHMDYNPFFDQSLKNIWELPVDAPNAFNYISTF